MAGTRGAGALSQLIRVPPSDRCPSPPVAPAMASSSPQSQLTISFPRTRSARRLAAPSAKGDPYALALRPSPRSKTSGPADPGQATPGTRSGRTTAQPLSPKVQPLSPRKRLGKSFRGDSPGMAGWASLFLPRGAGADRWAQPSPIRLWRLHPHFGRKSCSRGVFAGAEAPSPPGRVAPCHHQPIAPAGDDNLCNVPHALPGSPAKRSKENRGRRLLFGDPSASPEQPKSPGPSPRSRGPETPRSSGQHPRTQLFRQEGECEQGWVWGQGWDGDWEYGWGRVEGGAKD